MICYSTNLAQAEDKATVVLKELMPTKDKQVDDLKGSRAFGKVIVADVTPSKEKNGLYEVIALEASEKSPWGYMHPNKAGGWCQVVVYYTVDEETALRLSKRDELNIAGDIATAAASLNIDTATGKKKGKDCKVVLHLENVSAR